MGPQAFWKAISQPQFVGDEGGMEAQLPYPSSHLSALDGWMDGGKKSFLVSIMDPRPLNTLR